MKKLFVGMMVLALGGMAFASSLSVPWFVDNAPAAAGFPPSTGVSSIIYLHNTTAGEKVCAINYLNQEGMELGPAGPNNTFVIPAQATVAFRPVASDPASAAGGQESDLAMLIPNRPRDVDTKKNGAIVIKWVGGSGDVQGILQQAANVQAITWWGTLLPPGV